MKVESIGISHLVMSHDLGYTPAVERVEVAATILNLDSKSNHYHHIISMEKLRRIINQIAHTPTSQSLPPLHLSLIPLLFLSSSIYKLIITFRHTLYHLNFIHKHRYIHTYIHQPLTVIATGHCFLVFFYLS